MQPPLNQDELRQYRELIARIEAGRWWMVTMITVIAAAGTIFTAVKSICDVWFKSGGPH